MSPFAETWSVYKYNVAFFKNRVIYLNIYQLSEKNSASMLVIVGRMVRWLHTE